MREARFWKPLEGGEVRCFLCAHRCRLGLGERGKCGVRENRDGRLYSLVYARLVARHVDPVEKKPLYHFHPGSRSYSIATAGCNFKCAFCQNADISQGPRETGALPGTFFPAEEVATEAKKTRCLSIAYTYVEPTVFMEYALDVAVQARALGLKNVFVTNGFMTKEALAELSKVLDAANVDLKAFEDSFYKTYCGGRIKPVMRSIERMLEAGVWVEVTTLVIPGLNDDPRKLRELAAYLAGLSPDIPWHVSAFYPCYRMLDVPPTPASTLRRAREAGLEAGLRHVYLGNVPHESGENTFCPGCGAELIERSGFAVTNRGLRGGRCVKCGRPLAGVGMADLG